MSSYINILFYEVNVAQFVHNHSSSNFLGIILLLIILFINTIYILNTHNVTDILQLSCVTQYMLMHRQESNQITGLITIYISIKSFCMIKTDCPTQNFPSTFWMLTTSIPLSVESSIAMLKTIL